MPDYRPTTLMPGQYRYDIIPVDAFRLPPNNTFYNDFHSALQHRAHEIPRFLCLNELPRMPSPPKRQSTQSPFLRLPTEIRLQIYSLLLLPRRAEDLLPNHQKINTSVEDHFDYDKRQPIVNRPSIADLSSPTLLIRTINPTVYSSRHLKIRTPHLRSAYSVRSDRFRAGCMTTTYHCINAPRIEDQLSILRTCQKIHAEAAELLYSSYTFDFDTHIEAIVPFLTDLTPFARSCLKSLRIVKRALAYEKEFDRAEWSAALRYLTSASSGISLQRLELGIVAGRPGGRGWERTAKYSAHDFHNLKNTDGMEWMQYLLEFQGLQQLDVSAVVKHCAPATNSMAMARYIQFSASVDTSFADFLRGQLLAVAA
nr:hypothetical protein CFP56_10230 [Quercus suber]